MPEPTLIMEIIQVLAYLFIFAVGSLLLALMVIYIIDVSQTEHAIRRNYPVIGRFRHRPCGHYQTVRAWRVAG